MVVSTTDLIQKLKEVKPEGFEVSLRMGVFTVTKVVFLRRKRYYVFSMEEFFIFSWQYGYTEEEFEKEHKNWKWNIEETIS